MFERFKFSGQTATVRTGNVFEADVAQLCACFHRRFSNFKSWLLYYLFLLPICSPSFVPFSSYICTSLVNPSTGDLMDISMIAAFLASLQTVWSTSNYLGYPDPVNFAGFMLGGRSPSPSYIFCAERVF